MIWSVVGCCSCRWSTFSQPLVGGRWFFRSVVDGAFGRWSVVGGRWCLVGGAWSVDGGRCHCGRWSVVGGWSVGGDFVLRLCRFTPETKMPSDLLCPTNLHSGSYLSYLYLTFDLRSNCKIQT